MISLVSANNQNKEYNMIIDTFVEFFKTIWMFVNEMPFETVMVGNVFVAGMYVTYKAIKYAID